MALLYGPYLFSLDSDPKKQRTIAICTQPIRIETRHFSNLVEDRSARECQKCEDESAAMRKFMVICSNMVASEGWTEQGCSNPRVIAPKVVP